MSISRLIFASMVFSVSSFVSGGVSLYVVERGVPTYGVQTLQGFRAFTVGVNSTSPIVSVDLEGGGIAGSVLNRWSDPSSQSNYTQHSPGLYTNQNLAPSELNFDTHLLGDPSQATITQPLQETHELFGFNIRTNLTSTPSVGYGASTAQPTFNALLAGSASSITGAYFIQEAFRTNSRDIAYIVTDSLANGSFRVTTSEGVFVQTYQISLPEPGALGVIGGLFVAGLACGRGQYV